MGLNKVTVRSAMASGEYAAKSDKRPTPSSYHLTDGSPESIQGNKAERPANQQERDKRWPHDGKPHSSKENRLTDGHKMGRPESDSPSLRSEHGELPARRLCGRRIKLGRFYSPIAADWKPGPARWVS